MCVRIYTCTKYNNKDKGHNSVETSQNAENV